LHYNPEDCLEYLREKVFTGLWVLSIPTSYIRGHSPSKPLIHSFTRNVKSMKKKKDQLTNKLKVCLTNLIQAIQGTKNNEDDELLVWNASHKQLHAIKQILAN
jgi:hypothetical protein